MSFGDRLRQRKRELVLKGGEKLLRALEHFQARQLLVGNRPVFDVSEFPWTAAFERNWKSIRAELDEVLENREYLPTFHELSPDQKRISRGNNWKTYPLYVFGERFDTNCRRCPETARLLGNLPTLQNAWFSILAPGYHIPPHKGPAKAIIRCHLGLIVPAERDECYIRVDDRICHWDEGKCIVFDDTYEHEVWNNTDQERVVLFFDVDRPMRLPGHLLAKALIRGLNWSPYVRDARKNIIEWNSRYESKTDQPPAQS